MLLVIIFVYPNNVTEQNMENGKVQSASERFWARQRLLTKSGMGIPRYAIPLLGMILGNCMTGIALGPNTLTTSLMLRRASVEAQLMLGATRWDAAADSALSDWNYDEIGESRRI